MRATAEAVSVGSSLGTSVGSWRGRCSGWWERLLRLGRRHPKRLRLCESLALGDRRFVAVVEFDSARFLVGGTAASLVLLAQLADAETSGPPCSGAGSDTCSDTSPGPDCHGRGKTC